MAGVRIRGVGKSKKWLGAKALNETIRGMTRKRQLLISQATTKGGYESPGPMVLPRDKRVIYRLLAML